MKKCILVLVFLLIQNYMFYGTENINRGTRDTILKYGKEWQQNYNKFIPDIDLINNLDEKINKDLKIEIYLGLWCSDSENNVPKFIKIVDKLKNNMKINYFLCERKKNNTIKFFVEDKQVIRVPTFIFYRDNVEIGRITENPEKSLLEDFLEIVF